MSFSGPINLLNPKVKEDFNINLLKINPVSLAKQENILQKLAFMATFEEISEWVKIHSHGQRYIANPASASKTDHEICLEEIQKLLCLALKPLENRRKNGRDKRLIHASEACNYSIIADILASAAATYWRDNGYFNNENNLKIASFLKNIEKNIEKKEFQKAQIESIGAAVTFQKAQKKGVFQSSLDFDETEIILKNIDFED